MTSVSICYVIRSEDSADAPLDLSARSSPKSAGPVDPRDMAAAAAALGPLAAYGYSGSNSSISVHLSLPENSFSHWVIIIVMFSMCSYKASNEIRNYCSDSSSINVSYRLLQSYANSYTLKGPKI